MVATPERFAAREYGKPHDSRKNNASPACRESPLFMRGYSPHFLYIFTNFSKPWRAACFGTRNAMTVGAHITSK